MKSIQKLILLFCMLSCSEEKSDTPPNTLNQHEKVNFNLGISFPPVTDSEQRNFTTPLLKELNVKSIRIAEDWSFREPIKGEFNWTPLDERINWATKNGIEILLTIQSNGPDWACSTTKNQNSCTFKNNDHFNNYIELLLQRYANQIDKIQFGNEWQTNYWFIGNEYEFVEASNIVYKATQKYSPTTKFVLGGFTTISLRVLAGCNGLIDGFYNDEGEIYTREYLDSYCDDSNVISVKKRINYVLQNALYDLVDIHLYDDAENWPIYYENFKKMVQKPIIITEFGGPNVNIESNTESYQNERLNVYIKTIDRLNINEAYYFKFFFL